MDFRIQKAEFIKGLRLAQNIADRKSTMPMLANVLLRVSGKSQLLVAATDLNVSVSAELACKAKSDGGLTVGAKALFEIVSNLPGDEIAIKRTDNHWAEISAGKVNYRLVGMPDRDFPKIPDHREVALSPVLAETFRTMIDKTLFSVSNDETRFHLNGVFFECDGKQARMVSTDGHRLSKVERPLEGGPTLTAGIILPKKGVVEMKRALDAVAGNCEIAVKTPYLFVRGAEVTLAVKLIDSQFPPYEAVIPKHNTNQLDVSRVQLADALKRAQLMSSETRGVRLSVVPGTLRVSSDNPDLGEVKEELEATYDGPELTVGVNPKYVLELLGQIQDEQVRIELGGDLDPLLVRPVSDDGHIGVVMPMRI